MPTYNNALTNQPANRLAYPGGLAKRGGSLDSFVPLDYSRLAAGQFRQDTPQMREYAANVPVDVMRGRLAGMLGFPSDVLNMFRTPSPMEMFGQTDYEQPTQVPYGSEQFLKTLPLAPAENNPLGRAANRAGSLVPFTPMEALQAARMARQAAMATGKFVAPKAAQLTEGYMQRMGMMPSIVPVEGASVASAANLAGPEVASANQLAAFTRPKAEVSPLGFYSAVEQQALNIPRKSGTGASFINDLMKGQDVKKYEIEAMGLDEFLKGKPNVSREEVQNFIANNRIDVQERQLGGAIAEDPVGIAKRKAVFDKYEPQMQALYKEIDSFGYNTPREVTQSTDNRLRALQEMRDSEANAAYVVPEPTPTKYDKYQLPGGENYREILLTLPTVGEDVQKLNQISMQLHGKPYTDLMADTSEMAKMRLAVKREYKSQFGESGQNAQDRGMFKSSHFDEPNILAHMRVNDRIDADGKKMLLIEEVQSDWHQAGREKGYNTPERRAGKEKILNDLLIERQQLLDKQLQLEEMAKPFTSQGKDAPAKIIDEWSMVSNRLQNLQSEQNRLGRVVNEGVPDAPFKDTWHQLALKRAIKEAVDKGYDRIGLTTGAQQAERYNLSSHVQDLTLHGTGDNLRLSATAADGTHKVIDMQHVTPKTLPNYIGKEAAQKLLSQPEPDLNNPYAARNLFGADLQVGGEGMKKYYDEIYPAFLEKQGKKYGAKMGETRIKTGRGVPGGEAVRYLDITPEMRDAIKKGQPLASMQNELANRLA